MVEAPGRPAVQAHRQLAQRILASSHLNKSARLSELFSYLCERVLEHDVQTINELELGHKVFGRAVRYDTTADNIVRVHASLLRKRLAEYFANEGADEEFTIEIPRGNYAPVFRRRDAIELERPAPELPSGVSPVQSVPAPPATIPAALPATMQPPQAKPFAAYILPAVTVLLAAVVAVLGYRLHEVATASATMQVLRGPAVSSFWGTVFPARQTVDVVIDDAALSYYEESTGHTVPINDYFDRTYQRNLEADPHAPWLNQFVIRRQTNYSASSATWRLAQIAAQTGSNARLQFARDLAFRQAKTDNLVLLGTPQSDPWIQLFESSTTLHWLYDPTVHSFYPVDTALPGASGQYKTTEENRAHESYASIALLPNLGGSGRTLILSSTGGAAMDAAMDWLLQDDSLRQLRSKLPGSASAPFPDFEALLKVQKTGDHPRSVSIAVVRPLKASSR